MKFINPFNQLSGIYRILNRVNGNCYIGSSLNIEKGKPWSEKRRAAYLKKKYNEQIS